MSPTALPRPFALNNDLGPLLGPLMLVIVVALALALALLAVVLCGESRPPHRIAVTAPPCREEATFAAVKATSGARLRKHHIATSFLGASGIVARVPRHLRDRNPRRELQIGLIYAFVSVQERLIYSIDTSIGVGERGPLTNGSGSPHRGPLLLVIAVVVSLLLSRFALALLAVHRSEATFAAVNATSGARLRKHHLATSFLGASGIIARVSRHQSVRIPRREFPMVSIHALVSVQESVNA